MNTETTKIQWSGRGINRRDAKMGFVRESWHQSHDVDMNDLVAEGDERVLTCKCCQRQIRMDVVNHTLVVNDLFGYQNRCEAKR